MFDSLAEKLQSTLADVRSRLSEREPLNQSLYLWAKTVRVANDQILMLITSACVLNERYGLAA